MRVCTRCDDKVILKLPLVAVVNQINAGINSFVLHLGVGRNIAVPLRRVVTDEIVALARQFVRARHSRRRIGIAEFHPQHTTNFLLSRARL